MLKNRRGQINCIIMNMWDCLALCLTSFKSQIWSKPTTAFLGDKTWLDNYTEMFQYMVYKNKIKK